MKWNMTKSYNLDAYSIQMYLNEQTDVERDAALLG